MLKGKITHDSADDIAKSGYYYYSGASVKRSLYMDDVLYTISDSMIKVNSLNDMSELKVIELPYEYSYYGYGSYPETMPI